MGMRNHRALGLLAAIIVGCSCAGSYRTKSMIDRVEYASSYRLAVLCLTGPMVGSAVAISPRHLLTARHVVNCTGSGPIAAYAVGRGRWIPVTVDRWAVERDVARLVVVGTSSPFDDYSHVSDRRPALGETLCIIGGDNLTASWMRKCGDSAGITTDGDVVVALHVVQGNSGGPIFDASGDVLGIVNRGRWVDSGEFVMVGLLVGGMGSLPYPPTFVDID